MAQFMIDAKKLKTFDGISEAYADIALADLDSPDIGKSCKSDKFEFLRLLSTAIWQYT